MSAARPLLRDGRARELVTARRALWRWVDRTEVSWWVGPVTPHASCAVNMVIGSLMLVIR